MNIKQLQTVLNTMKLVPTPLVADGIAGKKTAEAVDALLSQSGADFGNWSDERRRVAAEQVYLKEVEKIDVGAIDGLVGEQVRYARSVWVARQANGGKPDLAAETWRDREQNVDFPTERPAAAMKWPRQDQVQNFYGAPGKGMVTMEMPFPLRIAWEPEKTVQRVSVHEKCKGAFTRVWQRTVAAYGYEELKRLRLDMYGGCLNVRKMRGGSRWSMHSFGCAWDVDPDRNQLKFKREQALLDEVQYKRFWEIVESEGGLSLGRLKNFDWMHFQFTSDLS